jgi:hypothetical protein
MSVNLSSNFALLNRLVLNLQNNSELNICLKFIDKDSLITRIFSSTIILFLFD